MPKFKNRWQTLTPWMTLAVALAAAKPPLLAQRSSVIQRAPSVQLTWRDAELRPSLERLVATHEMGLVLDRRLDPLQHVSLDQPSSPLDVAIQQLADAHGWGLSRLPHVLYLGPETTTRELATVLALQQEKVTKLPDSTRKRWITRQNSSWPEHTEPRKLVENWADVRKITLHKTERIPHDLWAAQKLPALSFLEQLTVALAGFDLSVEVNEAGTAQIIPLPRDAQWTRTYRIPTRLSAPEQLPFREPRNQIKPQGNEWVVRGSAEFHEWVMAEIASKRRPQLPRSPEGTSRPRSITQQRFTLTVRQQPLSAIVEAIARQTQSKVNWQDGTEAYQAEQRTVATQNATFEELMAQLMNGLPLSAEWKAGKITISKTTAD